MLTLKQFGIVLVFLSPGLVLGSTGEPGSAIDPSWVSILPPLVAIALALITRQAHLALFFGVWLGAVILNGGIISGLTTTLDTYIVESITDIYPGFWRIDRRYLCEWRNERNGENGSPLRHIQ